MYFARQLLGILSVCTCCDFRTHAFQKVPPAAYVRLRQRVKPATKWTLQVHETEETPTFESMKQKTTKPRESTDSVFSATPSATSSSSSSIPFPAMLTCLLAVTVVSTPSPALATAGPVPSAFMAWAHFIGILGVSGGLVAERFLIRRGLTVEEEMKMNNADGVYGLAALSLLISGIFRVTEYAKGWDFYKNEPIFWLKMSSVAVLGALSFFPAIILFRRDQARQDGQTLKPLSDPIIDRITTIINAELLALITIPLFATLMARGVLYVEGFPWGVGVVLYALCLGGAGFKYGKEAFDMMEAEGALLAAAASEED